MVLITLLQRKFPNFDALLPILCVGPNRIKYTFNLKLSPKSFLKIDSTCLMNVLFFSRSRKRHTRPSPRPNIHDIRAWARSSSGIDFFVLQLLDESIYILY